MVLCIYPYCLTCFEATQLNDVIWQVHQQGYPLLYYVPASSQDVKQQYPRLILIFFQFHTLGPMLQCISRKFSNYSLILHDIIWYCIDNIGWLAYIMKIIFLGRRNNHQYCLTASLNLLHLFLFLLIIPLHYVMHPFLPFMCHFSQVIPSVSPSSWLWHCCTTSHSSMTVFVKPKHSSVPPFGKSTYFD